MRTAELLPLSRVQATAVTCGSVAQEEAIANHDCVVGIDTTTVAKADKPDRLIVLDGEAGCRNGVLAIIPPPLLAVLPAITTL